MKHAVFIVCIYITLYHQSFYVCVFVDRKVSMGFGNSKVVRETCHVVVVYMKFIKI